MKPLKNIALCIALALTIPTFNSCSCSETFGLNVNPDFKYLGDIALNILSETSNSQDVDLLVKFINDADEGCCEKSNGTNTHDLKVNIYYDSLTMNPSSWGKPNQSGIADKKALGACEEDNGGTTSKFLKNGYYLVEMVLDFLDETKERDEANNNSNIRKSGSTIPHINTFEENAKFGNNRIYKIIHVQGIQNPSATQSCVIEKVY